MLHEVSSVLCAVANAPQPPRDGASSSRAKNKQPAWAPDLSAASYLSLTLLMALLPLPDWLFNGVVLRFLDVGLTASRSGVSTIARDVEQNRATEFADEFDDVFTLAEPRGMPLPALSALRDTLQATLDAQRGAPRIAGHVLLAAMVSSPPAGRAMARAFWLKALLSIFAASLLLGYALS
ncbi:hypothetical protein P43SY_003179 [Pythium insidiosum]|uniref:Uncharacterized protein n=1 Tax=Pythium insidiosum TaxID=114742 RepID=A0AAD5Q9E1_PYTIN|nr:hypothetical protein P43SY_003179 [Pythium insidiosum]